MTVLASAVKPAICGGDPLVTLPPPSWPVVGEADVDRVANVARSGKWSWIGPQEMAFCREYAEFIGSTYCLGLMNGTVTLQCALQAVGVVPGDEVIIPSLTWVATAQAAMDIGADVVFVDIDPETLCIDPEAIRAAITPRTRAIIPVHLYGCMCDMDAVIAIAREHDLKVVEDVAHQHGSAWRGRCAGAIGDVGSFSFQQSKILTCGEGGALTCSDEDMYRTIFALKQVGWAPDPETPFAPGEPPRLVPGNRYCHNYRMNEFQAAVLRGGLGRLNAQNEQREDAAEFLTERLAAMGGPLRVVARDPRVTRQAYYALTLFFDPEKAEGLHRNRYMSALTAEGCPVVHTYAAVYKSPLMNLQDRTSPIPFRDPSRHQDYAALDLPNVSRAVDHTAVTLPHQHLLGSRDYLERLLGAIGRCNDHLAEIREHFEAGLVEPGVGR